VWRERDLGILEGIGEAVTGFLIVFFILIILMVVIYLFKFLFGKKEKKAENIATAAEAPVNQTAQLKGLSEKKVVAIATAAIAASRGSSDCAFNVISIQKIS